MGTTFSWILTQLGFGAPDRKATLVIVGLDNAGKTTLLTQLVTGKLNSSLPPTQRATDETFHLGGITFNAWDLGGHEAVRHLWSEYSNRAHGILFMVDAADKRRFQEASEELELLLLDIAEAAKKLNESTLVPVAILFNKYDRDNVASKEEVVKALNLEQIMEDFEQNAALDPPPVEVFCGSVVENRGYQKAFQWLSTFVA